jgi:hypothetical protein
MPLFKNAIIPIYTGDKMMKTCDGFGPGVTPEEICNYYRAFCAPDPKFYCRICDTDLCKNEPIDPRESLWMAAL